MIKNRIINRKHFTTVNLLFAFQKSCCQDSVFSR